MAPLDCVFSYCSTVSCLAAGKALMDEAWECSPEQAMLNESLCLHHVNYVRTADVKEGIASFLQKRKPAWRHDAWDDLPECLPFKSRVDVRPAWREVASRL